LLGQEERLLLKGTKGILASLLVHHRGFIGMKGIVMEDLSACTAQEVLDDHLKLDEHFGAEEYIRRNVSEDIVILIDRGTFRGHGGQGAG